MPVMDKVGPRCHECTLKNQPGPVMGAGSRADAKLVYIAQNPGQNEVNPPPGRPMEPLIGASGAVFNRQLAQCGIRRSELYITNQVKCLTPLNRTPTLHEIACCKPIIEEELKHTRADTVLLAGDVAFQANIGSYSTLSPRYHPTAGLMSRMGCVEQRDGKKWIGTIHPAFIMRMPDYRQAALDHLKKAWKISGVPIPLPNVITHPSDEDIERHRQAAIANREFADDVEAVRLESGEWMVDLCGFSAVRYEAIVLDRHQMSLWQDIWLDEAIWRYEQNGVYEWNALRELGYELKNQKHDTMHALHYLRSYHAAGGEDDEKKSGLGLKLKPDVTSTFTLLPYFNRDLEKVDRRFYNGMDNIATFLAAREQRRWLNEWGIEKVFYEEGMKLPYVLDEWRKAGASVDLRRALLFRKFIENRIARADLMLSKIVGPFFNPNSPQQVAKQLYEDWGLPKQYNLKREGREVKKVLTTDNEARKNLRKWIHDGGAERQLKYNIPRLFLDIQDYAEGEKTKLTFLDRIGDDGRIHAYFKSHGTSSFRTSSTPNLQNWPIYDVSQWGGARRDVKSEGVEVPTGETINPMGSLRSIVIPDNPAEDWILTTDYEQMELWCYAQQTKCRWLLDIYEKRQYIHGIMYEHFYKLPFFEVGKPKQKKFKHKEASEKYLRRAKAIPLGFLYGRTAEAVALEHGWTVEETRKYRAEWFAQCPELLDSYARDRFEMEQKGYIRYPFGRVVHFPSGKPTDVYASRGQTVAAAVLIRTIIKLDEAIKRKKYPNTRMILSVHDSLSFNIPGKYVCEVYEETIAPILNTPYDELEGFSFRHSAEVGKRWDWSDEKMEAGAMDYERWKETQLGRRATEEATAG